MKVSVVIPTFNEEKVIAGCLRSLAKQSYPNMEIIVVDDGSTDETLQILSEIKFKSLNLRVYKQVHQGPGLARNLGAKKARGEILVFVDADMTFDKNFIEMLTKPIRDGKSIGTFSKEEYVANKDNVWSKCWNINKNLPTDKMHPQNYPNQQSVFRAILKKEFDSVGGFTPIGYIDDYTLSEKLKVLATETPGATFYHKNPQDLPEIFTQARWIGKSEFKKRLIKNEFFMKLVTLMRYSIPLSLVNGIYKSIKFNIPRFLIFKLTYDLAIEISVIRSFFGEQQYK